MYVSVFLWRLLTASLLEHPRVLGAGVLETPVSPRHRARLAAQIPQI